ncbi:MAG TPA: metallophosphatase domain-containing protein [Candidatus Binatia bacterium]|nr:metallophosphatase domain-containing protein [Candidatus Binatia bacterium]
MSSRLRLVLLSDTHTMHELLEIPDGDVLVHAGDFCMRGSLDELEESAAFFSALPHRHKVVVAGNHDRILEADRSLGRTAFASCHYLLDSGAEIGGLRFWGSPWQPEHLSWAFNLPRGQPLRQKWDLIPDGIDVLVTHGPPMGVMDQTVRGEHVGCQDLRDAVTRIRPRLHVFGHIHEARGTVVTDETVFVNASNCTVRYAPIHAPVVVDVETGGGRCVVME